MDMYLQFGYGMMAHTRELLENWGGGSVILSPRDLTESQIQRLSHDIASLNGEPLLDPQCYLRRGEHHRLLTHSYYQIYRSNISNFLLGGAGISEFLRELAEFVMPAGIQRFILPGLLADPVDESWFVLQERIISGALSHFGGDNLIATIALSDVALLDENQIEAVVERASNWPVEGFYVVGESPSGYLINHPFWLANLLILTSGLKLRGKKVIVGYSNHQLLCLAVANIDAIVVGSWQNVRTFSRSRFITQGDDIIQRAIWYYCPQALSEYKLPFLDMAKRRNILSELRTDASFGSSYATPLFSGHNPSTIGWGEGASFRHYLTCLHFQAGQARKDTYQETLTYQRNLLSTAEDNLRRFNSFGILGQQRDFTPYIDVNRSALIDFDHARGHQMSRNW